MLAVAVGAERRVAHARRQRLAVHAGAVLRRPPCRGTSRRSREPPAGTAGRRAAASRAGCRGTRRSPEPLHCPLCAACPCTPRGVSRATCGWHWAQAGLGTPPRAGNSRAAGGRSRNPPLRGCWSVSSCSGLRDRPSKAAPGCAQRQPRPAWRPRDVPAECLAKQSAAANTPAPSVRRGNPAGVCEKMIQPCLSVPRRRDPPRLIWSREAALPGVFGPRCGLGHLQPRRHDRQHGRVHRVVLKNHRNDSRFPGSARCGGRSA